MSFALFFPGQGAQYVGMGKEIHGAFPRARALFEQADRVLGFPLTRLCFEGPGEELNLTIHAQPAIYVVSLAIWEVIRDRDPECAPAVTCGLSVGEFSALTAAHSLSFEEGLHLVRKRGEWMHEAGEKNPGAMCSVIGLNVAVCEELAKEASVEVANYNSPDQTVLSGSLAGIDRAMILAKEKGAKRVIPLKVSGAFHSQLMAEAGIKLKEELRKVRLHPPRFGFVPNVRASMVSDPAEIRDGLAEQVTQSVRWMQTVQLIHARGIRLALEMGPGKVLQGLVRRVVNDFAVRSVESVEDMEKAMAVIHGAAV